MEGPGRRKFFTFVSLLGIGFTLMSMLVVVALADHFLAPSYPEVHLDRMLVLDRMEMSGIAPAGIRVRGSSSSIAMRAICPESSA